MKIIKIKISENATTIWYNKKKFKNRREATEGAIHHLQKLLELKIIDAES